MNEFDRAGKILENRRREMENLQASRKDEVSKKIPGYKKLTRDIAQANINYLYEMRKSDGGDAKDCLQLVKDLKSKRDDLLEKNGYPRDYTERQYYCNICNDTGEVNGNVCKCKKDIIISEKIKNASLHSGVEEENFENFDFEIFSNEKPEGKPASPRDLARFYYDEFKDYCKNFSSSSKSLFITGPVGTGKTYFCNCISHELLAKNVNVVYLTSADLMKKLRNYNLGSFEFEEKNRQDYQLIIESDLLIIDDLGSEQISQYNVSNLFNLINERLNKKKPVIISTNVSFSEIRELYDERIYSRLKTYELYTLYGEDLRGDRF
ncbi:ATP-binding protein [Lagierella sp.]|uniref:ATP-binding protein n=1 Tax=Lagierella sp. TaxID=2849657 RepID=UPI00263916AD|nr:ATP-binding protein [Lagierella sp.]